MAPTEQVMKCEGRTEDQPDATGKSMCNQPTIEVIDLISDSENEEDEPVGKTNQAPASDTTLQHLDSQSTDSLLLRLKQENQNLQQALTRSRNECEQSTLEKQRLTRKNRFLRSGAVQLSQDLKRAQDTGSDKDRAEIERLKCEGQLLKIETRQLKEENIALKENIKQQNEDYQKLAVREAELVEAMRTKFGVPSSTLKRLNEITQELRMNEKEFKQRQQVLKARAAQAAKEFEANREAIKE